MFARVSRAHVRAPPGHLSAILVGRRANYPPRRHGSTQPGPPEEKGGPAGQGETLETSASISPSSAEEKNDGKAPPSQKRRKTMAELDEELQKKMAGIAGDGGEAGIEYEDGQPVAMKRSVKNNMFRYI